MDMIDEGRDYGRAAALEGAPGGRSVYEGFAGQPTLDGLLAAHAARTPGRLAIQDAPDRGRLCDGAPASLTFAQADIFVDRLAGSLLALGLKSGDAVAVQLGNVVEAHLTLLAVMRAGLIACPLPPLWREHEIKAALAQVPPRAIVTSTRIGRHHHGDQMRFVAAQVPSVRHVLAFGPDVPDGVLAMDDMLAGDDSGLRARPGADAAERTAIITWSIEGAVGGAGMRPVARSHAQWLAAAAMHVRRAELGPGDTLLSPLFPSSMMGLASGFATWLLSGARLALYQAGGEDTLAAHIAAAGVTHAVLPAAVAAALAPELAALAASGSALKAIACAWPSPELAALAPAPAPAGLRVHDLYAFGETAFHCAPRGPEQPAGTVPLGICGEDGGDILLQTRLDGAPRKASDNGPALAGRLCVRGAMVPNGMAGDDGFAATGIACAVIGRAPAMLRFTGRLDGVVTVGGAPVSLACMDALLEDHSGVREAAMVALPDPVLGHRLHAATVAAPAGHVSLASLHSYLAARKVAPYKFPEAALSLDAMPRSQDGQVDRVVLADRMAEGAEER